MFVALDDEALKTPLIQMAAAVAVMGAITLDVRVANPRKVSGQVLIGARDDCKVKVVAQEAKGQQRHVRMLLAFDEQLDERGEITVLVEDSLAAVAAVQHVINQSASGGACDSWHDNVSCW